MIDDIRALPGGGVGGAVRVGDAVRRPAGLWTPTVHALLRYLRAAGIDDVPEPLGTDGRFELLSLIEGDTVYSTRPPRGSGWPEWVWADSLLVDVGRWLRRYHDAVQGFRPPAPTWRSGSRPLGADEIVCHFDLRPANVIVDRTGTTTPRLVGVVDWDTAGPGRPLHDLALTAWSWIPLWQVADRPDSEVARRLVLLADAYGEVTPHEIVASVPDRLIAATELTRSMAAAGDTAMQQLIGDQAPPAVSPTTLELRRRLPRLLAALDT